MTGRRLAPRSRRWLPEVEYTGHGDGIELGPIGCGPDDNYVRAKDLDVGVGADADMRRGCGVAEWRLVPLDLSLGSSRMLVEPGR
jgi:hypothetical protein